MVGNELEQKIISIYNKDLTGLYSINQISKKLNKAYPHINKKVNDLINCSILRKVTVGRSYLCSINLSNDMAVNLLSQNHILEKERLARKSKDIQDTISLVLRIKEKYRIHSAFFYDGKIHMVLDYLNDKDSIINNFPRLSDHTPVFMDLQGLRDIILDKPDMLSQAVVIYAYERYFEAIKQLEEKLLVRSSLFSGIMK